MNHPEPHPSQCETTGTLMLIPSDTYSFYIIITLINRLKINEIISSTNFSMHNHYEECCEDITVIAQGLCKRNCAQHNSKNERLEIIIQTRT